MFPKVGSRQQQRVSVGKFDDLASKNESSAPPSSSGASKSVWVDVTRRFPFIQKCEIFFPVGDVNLGYKLAPIMEPLFKHFYGANMSPMALTSPEFKSILKTSNADMYAITSSRRVDADDTCALYPHGELVLSLTKDTLLSTGFSKSNEHTTHHNATLSPQTLDITPSIISIDLRSDTENRQTHFARTSNIIENADFFLNYEMHADSSMKREETEQKLFSHFSSLSRFLINSERLTLRGVQVPKILVEDLLTLLPDQSCGKLESEPRSLSSISAARRDQVESNAIQEIDGDFIDLLFEWVGAMHCRVRSYLEGNEISSDVSLFTPDALTRVPMHGLVFRHEGFLIPCWVQHQIRQAKAVVDAGMSPYAIVTAWSFVDQPLQNIHHFRDSHYTFIILPGDLYILSTPLL